LGRLYAPVQSCVGRVGHTWLQRAALGTVPDLAHHLLRAENLTVIQTGHTVRLIETDSQGTLSNWQARRSYAEPLVEPVYSAGDIEGKLLSLNSSGVTLTIIDTAGGVGAVTTAAIRYADLCLIPSRPSVADVEATASTLSNARAWNTHLLSFSIKPRFAANASATPQLFWATSCRTISPVSSRYLTSLCGNDHQDALALGLAVIEYAPASKSADEVRASGSGSRPDSTAA
jgi:chromosome partitioning protein